MRSKTMLACVILTVSTMSLFGCDLQYGMLYYPEARLPSPAQLAAQRLQFWPSGPAGYRGFIAPAGGGRSRGTVIVLHGNAGTAADRGYYAAALTPLGYRVILAEYPGYGRREGPLGEASLVADARTTIRLAAETYGAPLFLLGESLGCGVAAGAASDPSLPVAGILLITPWETLRAVARDHFPWLPLGLILKDRYDNRANLSTFPGRIAVVGAQRDEIVPLRHAEALYASLPGPKKMWVIPGAGHNDWPLRLEEGQWKAFMDFIAEGA
jgi:hypothetical protein